MSPVIVFAEHIGLYCRYCGHPIANIPAQAGIPLSDLAEIEARHTAQHQQGGM